jgi:hypothetical protein
MRKAGKKTIMNQNTKRWQAGQQTFTHRAGRQSLSHAGRQACKTFSSGKPVILTGKQAERYWQ